MAPSGGGTWGGKVEQGHRIVFLGRPMENGCNNSVRTSKYTLLTFLPIAIKEQFRRNGNIYFLVIGILMAIGWYSDAFDSAISPWTTLGPLAIVVSISLLQEGVADLARHRSDSLTNSHPCVVLRRIEELEDSNGVRDPTVLDGQNVTVDLTKRYHKPSRRTFKSNASGVEGGTSNSAKIAFEQVQRMNIYAGNLVLVRNRDMVPADIILLATSSEGGSAYIETSSIDGETNLKLRNSPQMPLSARSTSSWSLTSSTASDISTKKNKEGYVPVLETLEEATKRITRFSLLGFPEGTSALENPFNVEEEDDDSQRGRGSERPSLQSRVISIRKSVSSKVSQIRTGSERAIELPGPNSKYVGVLTSEQPNASVNTYSGKLTLPPVRDGESSVHIPLNADNMLLRGAVLRNTEWAIGLACFTGADTKLVKNSFQTPSKFSRLDQLINRTVIFILILMLACVLSLAGFAVSTNSDMFDTYWYLGYTKETSRKWPYLRNLEAPEWDTETDNYGQMVFLFITLLNNFVPLSLYVTVEIITFALMWYINVDLEMYHEKSDTPALARSTIVTDLGQVDFVFSDKTGTLTRNVMRFKRCSVDGMAFGAPIEKAAPTAAKRRRSSIPFAEQAICNDSEFHPLRQLLVGAVEVPAQEGSDAGRAGLEGLGEASGAVDRTDSNSSSSHGRLTFNAEMFLRVMSLCHTVVVEKNLDASTDDESQKTSKRSKVAKYLRGKKSTGVSDAGSSQGGSQNETQSTPNEIGESVFKDDKVSYTSDVNNASKTSSAPSESVGPDGAPLGYAYQAESPDEGALVSAASLVYGFQFVERDSSGAHLRCSSLSFLSDKATVRGIKAGRLTPKILAAETASPLVPDSVPERSEDETDESHTLPRAEVWEILAINKFDSDRKRMSVLVRSPAELGSIPMLLCKGADSSMLDANVCEGANTIMAGEEEGDFGVDTDPTKPASGGSVLTCLREDEDDEMDRESVEVSIQSEEEEWEMAAMLGIQAHLGDFASEGLRTLVLGVRILTEEECSAWLSKYQAASTSIKNRDEKLTAVAAEIEKKLHIVGATAIEDKLQRGVPETIASLGRAGIKLWVLTGDKRETAIEIGYSTKVLVPKMHLTEVPESTDTRVKTAMAMEFVRLVKLGKLGEYQRSALDTSHKHSFCSLATFMRATGKLRRRASRAVRRFWYRRIRPLLCACVTFGGYDDTFGLDMLKMIAMEEENEKKGMLDPIERRRAVRNLADEIIKEYLDSPEGVQQRKHRMLRKSSGDNGDVPDDDDDLPPTVFNRAESARAMLDLQRTTGKLKSQELRTLSIARRTSLETPAEAPLVDEDTLSLDSFFPGQTGHDTATFDKRKRTLLERMFAVDREVRHGRLVKHLTASELEASLARQARADMDESEMVETSRQLDEEKESHPTVVTPPHSSHGPRALVIEGAALARLLGDPLLEEILFAVASSCEAVIACRVSPKQKALLVKMVRNFVSPTPVTLAIGDGANDVGMIQEAHVGIGISGLEGQQAVNASDFAIAQFRFLEDLLLVHGRWSFIRMAKVVLFSFYKNAFMAFLMIVFAGRSLYSGTPLFDQWVISMLNFVAAVPILSLGFFDRDIDRGYVKRNPEVYSSGPDNEHLTNRIIFRWVILLAMHVVTVYFLCAPPLSDGGGVTSAFSGLMANEDRDVPGNGEGGDLQTFGTTIYTQLIFTLAYKVLYETKSLIHGHWPAFTCRKGVGEGVLNRLAYTWISVTWLSIFFYLFGIYIYQLIGRSGYSTFSSFVMVTSHVLNMRSISWMLVLLVPTAACAFDVIGKTFSNMYYPTQTQIHLEIAAKERAQRAEAQKKEKEAAALRTETATESGPVHTKDVA